jgi:hypothetical protein
MNSTEALREFAEKYGNILAYAGLGTAIGKDKMLSDLTALLEQHKEMMLREELIKYDKWLCQHDLGYKFDTNEKCVDEYIKSLKP